MGDLRTYEPGTPSWVDLGSPDPAKAADFYDALFGWEAVSQGSVEETGGYMMFRLDGKDVGGLGPIVVHRDALPHPLADAALAERHDVGVGPAVRRVCSTHERGRERIREVDRERLEWFVVDPLPLGEDPRVVDEDTVRVVRTDVAGLAAHAERPPLHQGDGAVDPRESGRRRDRAGIPGVRGTHRREGNGSRVTGV